MKKLFYLLFCILVASSPFAKRDIDWCEADVSLTKSGRQDIIYKIRWDFPFDTMSGFDMQGFDKAQPFFDYENSCVYENGSKTPRKIKIGEGNSEGLYPIDIDGGSRLRENAVWVVRYATDFYGAKYIGYTENKELGKLVYVDWCPLIWDQPMNHYTVYWHFPFECAGEKPTKEELAKFHIYTD
ncbi:MAG: hypothetical protein KBT47_03405, partial [Armatimonadetes bacterium]|nr:hypothetical protein [Candidatus Hippobium faecium]